MASLPFALKGHLALKRCDVQFFFLKNCDPPSEANLTCPTIKKGSF